MRKPPGQCRDCACWADLEDGDDPPMGSCLHGPPTEPPTRAERLAGEDRWNFRLTAAEQGCWEFKKVFGHD